MSVDNPENEDFAESPQFHVEPCLTPDGLYTASQLIIALGISNKTLNKWKQERLRCTKPRHCSKFFFRGSDVIEFMFREVPY